VYCRTDCASVAPGRYDGGDSGTVAVDLGTESLMSGLTDDDAWCATKRAVAVTTLREVTSRALPVAVTCRLYVSGANAPTVPTVIPSPADRNPDPARSVSA
jgi:hypothetical protein